MLVYRVTSSFSALWDAVPLSLVGCCDECAQLQEGMRTKLLGEYLDQSGEGHRYF